MGGGNNTGMRASDGPLRLLLNSDAWVDRRRGSTTLVAFADAHPRAAVVGPRLRNPDGSLQRSVRGEPTLWRLATEYLFLRKLAPRTQALQRLLRRRLRPRRAARGRVALRRGAARPARGGRRGRAVRRGFFMFSEETDWLHRFRQAGWQVWFTPAAEVVHLGGASHGGRLYVENLRGILRFLAKHRGPREAERARLLLLWSLRLRALLFRGERGERYRDGVRFLESGDVPALLAVIAEYLRLAFATGRRAAARVPRRAGARPARRARRRSSGPSRALFVAWAAVFVVHAHDLARASRSSPAIGIAAGLVAVRGARPAGRAAPRPRRRSGRLAGRAPSSSRGVVLGLALWHVEGAVVGDALFHEARVRKLVELAPPAPPLGRRARPRRAPPRLRVPALARLPRARREGLRASTPRSSSTARPRCSCRSRSCVAWEAGVAVFRSAPGGIGVLAASVGALLLRRRPRRLVRLARAAGHLLAAAAACPPRSRSSSPSLRVGRRGRPRGARGRLRRARARPPDLRALRADPARRVRASCAGREWKRSGARARRRRSSRRRSPCSGCGRSSTRRSRVNPTRPAPGGDARPLRRRARRQLGAPLPARRRGARAAPARSRSPRSRSSRSRASRRSAAGARSCSAARSPCSR